ncbi:MAG: hypothetical protein ACE5JX_18565 [Acidobacteriota bacterium]
MTERMTFIHLVSEQTLQNLLPILAFRPARIVQVRSRGHNEAQARSLRSAVRYLARSCPTFRNYSPQFSEHELSQSHPTLDKVSAELAPLFAAAGRTVLNYTGGTKMMSIGAFERALRCNARALYCDTAKSRFVWTPGEKACEGLDFQELPQLLSVPLLVTANGLKSDRLRFKTPAAPELQFGRGAWSFKRQASDLFLDYERRLRGHFRCARGKIPGSRREIERLVADPLPSPPCDGVEGYLGCAAAHGLLRKERGSFFPRCRGSTRKELRRALEALSNLLDGSWLELFVLDLLQRNPAFGDARWSLQPLKQEEEAFGETDLACVDRQACLLRVISCKQSLLARTPLEHMEALSRRARTLGGSHARPMLAVLRVREEERAKYRAWARSLGVELLIGDEIRERFQPRNPTDQGKAPS